MNWTHTLVIALAIVVAGMAMSSAQPEQPPPVYTISAINGVDAWVAGDGKIWRCISSGAAISCKALTLP